MYPALKFRCKLTSTFHTSYYNYSNLYTCAPYIMGSTLRGAILRCLIDEVKCPRLERLHVNNPGYHSICDVECPIKPLFALPTRFSFGRFRGRNSNQVYIHTRVGISRDKYSASEGALASVEVRRGDEFTFEVMYPDIGMEEYIKKGVELAGSRFGIGRFRSIGWGQFEICSYEYVRPIMPKQAQKYRFELLTPYVLGDDLEVDRISREKLYQHLCDATPDTAIPEIEDDIQIEVTSFSYVRRWSDEQGSKDNQLVIDRGSKLLVSFSEEVSPEHLYLWQWGIGKWHNYGFGSFRAYPE